MQLVAQGNIHPPRRPRTQTLTRLLSVYQSQPAVASRSHSREHRSELQGSTHSNKMRLINTETLHFTEFLGAETPPYAILSHTWEEEEVSLREMTDRLPGLTHRKGYRKVADYCRLAAQQGYSWAWVDTCCIDKTSTAELSESINSMFRWYQEADICHVFLSDLPMGAEFKTALPGCRWFTRGWTLQELIAPRVVEFYDRVWSIRGTKRDLVDELSAITGVLDRVLLWSPALYKVGVGVRMSWAAKRETTRPEDMAYCLLGIFDVNMPLLYGEGKKAFRRLQEAIIRQSNDLTIFAFGEKGTDVSQHQSQYQLAPSLLAESPSDFSRDSPSSEVAEQPRGPMRTLGLGNKWSDVNPEYTVTNKGLRITTSLVVLNPTQGAEGMSPSYFLPLGEIPDPIKHSQWDIIGVILLKIAPNLFLRRSNFLRVLPFWKTTAPILTPSLDLYIGMDKPGDVDNWIYQHGAIDVYGGSIAIRSDVADTAEGNLRAHPSHAAVKVGHGIPESHWDWSRCRFFRSSNDPLVFALSLIVKFGKQDIDLICLIDQRETCPTPYIFKPSEHPVLARWFSGRKSAREDTFWEDLPDPRAQEPRSLFGDGLDVLVGGVSYRIRARQHTSEILPIPHSRAVFKVSFDITRHPAALSRQEPSQVLI